MADTENMPPTSSSSRQKPVVKSAKSKAAPSDRKKLQTLQPSGRNQKLLVRRREIFLFRLCSHPLLAGWS